MKHYKILITILFIVTFFLCACVSEKDSAILGLDKVHEKIKAQQFGDIYEDGSTSLKNCYSKNEFIDNMFEATQKLKSIDENIDFWKAKYWEKDMNNGYEDWNLPKEYKKRQFYLVRGIGSDSNTDDNYYKKATEFGLDKTVAHELTIWENNNGEMKLVAYQVVGFKNDETKFYGNKNICWTTSH